MKLKRNWNKTILLQSCFCFISHVQAALQWTVKTRQHLATWAEAIFNKSSIRSSMVDKIKHTR